MRFAILSLAIIAWVPAQSATRVIREDRLVAVDQLESKGVAWIRSLAGDVSGIRSAGEGALSFVHVTEKGERRFWLLHLATGVVRPLDLADRGVLRAASREAASRPAAVMDDLPIVGAEVIPKQEPETTTSGFFSIDDAQGERRTAYEASNWDNRRHPDEARMHARLLDRFLDGVQWPFRRESGYEPYFASDDMPLRAGYAIPHLGLDVGARLMHTPSGSVAFHAGGTPVLPLYRGGQCWIGPVVSVRDGKLPISSSYRILQEVELREKGYLLRVHLAYDHVRPLGGDLPSGPAPVTGDDAMGELETYDASSPSGGWTTGAPELLAAGIAKGNHLHLGTGGIYQSFNEAPEMGGRKLAWYRERLLPALMARGRTGR